MGKVKKVQNVKLVIGMLAIHKKLFETAEEFFIKEFGDIDYKSPILLFNYTQYYKKEMGHPLKKSFISFKKLIEPNTLSKIKLATNSIEEQLAKKGERLIKRPINIDPGYISDSKLVLASTKDYFHRIYIGDGIFAEVTLTWKKGTFEPFLWTYPDYKTKEYLEILNTIRNFYMKERSHETG